MSQVRHIEFAQFNQTNVHPFSVALVVCMVALVFRRSRQPAILAVLTVCVFMPMDQRIVIGGLDLNMLRLILMAAWLRVLSRREYRGLTFGKLDRVIVLWVLSASLFHVLRVGPSGIVYRLGVAFDALTAYFLIRVLVRTPDDLVALWRQLGWIVILLSPFLLYELVTQHNPFGIFFYDGFKPVDVRDGRARCQGPFLHPILAGTFGAATMPVFVAMFRGRRNERRLFALACLAATAIVFASGSSGSLLAWIAGLVGWAIWRFRKHTRTAIWSALGMALVIHFVREQPVWHLIGRLSEITGGTGYHRFYLIDQFIRRFGEWALVGTDNTASWGWGLQDTTNQYVVEGIRGGIVSFVLFIAVLGTSFIILRHAREAFERSRGPISPGALLSWGVSVALAVHCVSFMSVTYFDQMFSFFLMFLATAPALARFGYFSEARS